MINRPNFSILRRRMFSFALCCSTLLALVFISGNANAQEQLAAGSSSKKFRNQTVKSLPYNQLNQQTKDKIGDILAKPSIYRRLPVTSIVADPDYFRFLVRYPEVIVNIWQLMGVTQMTTERVGPYVVATNDGAGTISNLELVYGTDNLHIFYGTGSYEGSVIKRKLRGGCVLVLRTESHIGSDRKPIATSQLDVFLKVENATAGLIAKTISPLVGSTADHNFVETMKFVQRLNDTTSKNGPGVQKMGKKLSIDAETRRKFNDVVDVVFQRAINASAPAGNSVRPASMETQYSPPSQPPRTLNGYQDQRYQAAPGYRPSYQTTPQATPTRTNGYESRNEFGQNRKASYEGFQFQNGYAANPYSYQQSAMPARGSQSPQYPINNFRSPMNQNGQAYGIPNRPIQAGYENRGYGAQQVQPAGGWQRR